MAIPIIQDSHWWSFQTYRYANDLLLLFEFVNTLLTSINALSRILLTPTKLHDNTYKEVGRPGRPVVQSRKKQINKEKEERQTDQVVKNGDRHMLSVKRSRVQERNGKIRRLWEFGTRAGETNCGRFGLVAAADDRGSSMRHRSKPWVTAPTTCASEEGAAVWWSEIRMLSFQWNGGWKAELTLLVPARALLDTSCRPTIRWSADCWSRAWSTSLRLMPLQAREPYSSTGRMQTTYNVWRTIGVDDDEAQLGRHLVDRGRDEAWPWQTAVNDHTQVLVLTDLPNESAIEWVPWCSG